MRGHVHATAARKRESAAARFVPRRRRERGVAEHRRRVVRGSAAEVAALVDVHAPTLPRRGHSRLAHPQPTGCH